MALARPLRGVWLLVLSPHKHRLHVFKSFVGDRSLEAVGRAPPVGRVAGEETLEPAYFVTV